jgi:hypothetical protein
LVIGLLVILAGVALLTLMSIGSENPVPSSTPVIDTLPPPAVSPPSGGSELAAWLVIAIAWAIELMSKATFWICACLLWAASIVSSAISSAVSTISYKLEELIDRTRPRRNDDEGLDDDL